MSSISRWPVVFALTSLLAVGSVTAACDRAGSPLSPAAAEPWGSSADLTPEARRDLAALRAATAPYHQFDDAVEAGWSLQVTDCMEDPALGGMGYHYGHLGFYLDGEANVLEPEVLLFAPRPDGELRLVAVEYLVPHAASADAPQLFGREMALHGEDWILHVWAWEHNPDGLFADWNPRVSCS